MLNIFKGGFYSKNEDVVTTCGMLFQKLIQEINATGGEMVGDAWDWFITPTQADGFTRGGKGNDKVQ